MKENGILVNRENPEAGESAGHKITKCEVIGSWVLAIGGVVVGVVSTSVTIYNLVEHTG